MSAQEREHRVLVLAPTLRDAENSSHILGTAGIATAVCRSMEEVCAQIGEGAGAVVVTEESLAADRERLLSRCVREQPQWSDLPVIVLTRGGPDSAAAVAAMQTLGNVILLERPVRIATFVTAARTGLRERERQYELRRLLAQLREADRRKDVFLAMLAHELRNPLAPIRNATEIFRHAARQDPMLTRASDIVARQVGLLARLVDDLLDVSRITQGKVQLKPQRFDLRASVSQAVETVSPMMDAKRQRLQVNVPAGPVPIDADPTRITQVLGNLLNNAAKYTPHGGRVWLTVRRSGDAAVVRVRDNGVGIPREMLPGVFDLFTQVDTTLDHSQGGLGVGLTLVRAIVEMHGGRVRARSHGKGQGSCFLFWLPALPAGAAPGVAASGADAAPARRQRLLLVDDNVDAVESLAILLRGQGHDVRTAYEGRAALGLVDSHRPDLVVLDIGLPGMDGYEIARRIRARPELTGTVLVALTGYGQPEDRGRARDAGFDHHLIKPAGLAELTQLLARAAA